MESFKTSRESISGIVYPVVTAFNSSGFLSFDGTKRYVKYLLDNGARNIMAASATGRFAHLSTKEIKVVNRLITSFHLVYTYNAIVSTPINGSIHTHIDVLMGAKNEGAKIAICEYPWRYQGSEALIKYFKDIARETDMGIVLHVTPARSEIETSFGKTHRFEINDLIEICKIPNVIGFKEASGDAKHSKTIWETFKDNKDIGVIVSGNAANTYIEAAPYNVAGYFAGTESVYPDIGTKIEEFMSRKDIDSIKKINVPLNPLLTAGKIAGWHSSLKYMLYEKDIMSLNEPSPMVPISSNNQTIIKELMDDIRDT